MNIRDLIRAQIDTLQECLEVYYSLVLVNSDYSFSDEERRIKEKIKKLRFELFKEYFSSLWVYIENKRGTQGLFCIKFDNYDTYNQIIDTAFILSCSVYVRDEDIESWFNIKHQEYVVGNFVNINGLQIKFASEKDFIKKMKDYFHGEGL